MAEETQFEQRLLQRIEDSMPLVREPYAQIAAELGCGETELLAHLAGLRGEGGVIREISGIFDVSRLGYRQSLVALAVPEDRLDEAGRIVAAHPGVSHCYGRANEWNLWFTLAVSPASCLGLEGTVARLCELCGARSQMILPTLRQYKLRVRLAGQGEAAAAETPRAKPHVRGAQVQLDDAQRRAVAALQQDLPNCTDPFATLAKPVGMGADELLVHAADMLAAGCLRRYSAVLHHLQAGFPANVMVVWQVGEAEADAAGAQCAQLPAISHCYVRPSSERWPYSLYTMIHGRNRQDCQMTVEEIVARTGMLRRAELWTREEYKKQRVVLFSDEEAAWESR